MTDQSRKEFLKKLAQGSIYAAPVVSTLLAPRPASGGGPGSPMMMMGMGGMGMGMGGMGMGGMGMGGMGMGMPQQRNLPDAPWFKPRPGR